MLRLLRLLHVITILWLGLASWSTRAAEGGSRCSRLAAEGIRLSDAGEATPALPILEEAQRCKPNPRLLLHIGQCQLQLGQLDEALGSFRTAREQAGSDSDVAKVAALGIANVEKARAVAEPAPPPPEPEVKERPEEKRPQEPLYKRWWLWTAVGGAAALILVGSIAGTWPRLPDDSSAERISFSLTARF